MPLLRDIAIAPYFVDVIDPRVERTRDHALLDLIIIAIAACICGADSWVAVEEFGRAKRPWLETILTLPNGIPSHDTFGRVFARIDPVQFQTGFVAWVQAIQHIRADLIAIDGKTHRGTLCHCLLDAGVSFEWQKHAANHARKMSIQTIAMPYFSLPRKEQLGVKDVMAERRKTHRGSFDQASSKAALHLVRHPEGTRGE